jgi:hypothetical protein
LVLPFLPFVGLTVAAIVKNVVADYTASMAKKKLAKSFLIERIDSKIEQKFGKGFLKQRLDNDALKKVRRVIHEELSAYSPQRKDIDQLIVNSINKLTNEHQQILTKLTNVESLLQKISIPLSYSLNKETEEGVPEELLTGLLEGSLQGAKSSLKVLTELSEGKEVPTEVFNILKEFEFIREVSSAGETEISKLVKKFKNTPEEINNLNTLLDISSLLVGSNENMDSIVSEFVFKMISEGLNTSSIEDSVISFCFLIHRLGKLEFLSESDRLILNSFLRKHLKQDDPTRKLEAYFLLSVLRMSSDLDQSFIKELLSRQKEQGIASTREMVGQLRVDGRLAQFLRKLGFRRPKSQSSIKTINHLIRKLDKRKFLRSTQLLKYQLDRLITEINLLIVDFEKNDAKQVNLSEIINLLQSLMEILNRPGVLKLDLETRKRIVELMDASYYLYDLVAIRNSWGLLHQYQLEISSLYSPTLGKYQRVITDQAAFNLTLDKFSQKRLRHVDRELPSPPRKPVRKKIRK